MSSAPRIRTLAEEYRRDFATRFRRIRGLIRTSIVENDALSLKSPSGEFRARQNARPAGPDEFSFPTDARKIEGFREWLRGALDEGALEVTPVDEVMNGRHYTAGHLRTGYDRGLDYADARLREQGREVEPRPGVRAFNLPIHENTLEEIYTRNYRLLENITDDMAANVSRVLSDSLADGAGAQETASRLTSEVKGMTRKRADVLAPTEMSNAFNTASARRYEQYGVEQVDVIPSDPCPVCQRLVDGNPHPIEKAAGLLPAHPRCVCGLGAVVL